MHLGAVRAVQHQPPVAELVTEPLEHQRAVVGQVAGGLALAGQVAEQVGGSQLVEPVGVQPAGRGRGSLAPISLQYAPIAAAELGRAAWGVPMPERQLAWLARRGRDDHLVGRDVLDPPRACAENEDVADPGLVDHLLVELADPPGVPAGAVRLPPTRNTPNSPRSGIVPPLVTASRWPPGRPRSVPVGPVPDQPRPQPGEVLARVAPGQHVEHRLEHRPGQPAERRRAAHRARRSSTVPVVHRGHRHDLLREHVERVARHPQLFDLAAAHPPGHDRGLHQVALVLGEDHAAGDVADVVRRPGRCAAGRWPPTAAIRPV